MRNNFQIKLPASITDATLDQAGQPRQRHDHPIKESRSTGRANASRRPTAAPRRGGY